LLIAKNNDDFVIKNTLMADFIQIRTFKITSELESRRGSFDGLFRLRIGRVENNFSAEVLKELQEAFPHFPCFFSDQTLSKNYFEYFDLR
jgi:hypothetical protein